MSKTLLLCAFYFFLAKTSFAQTNRLSVNWNKVVGISKTTATLQLVENPMVRPSSPIHKNVFKALKNLKADYVRYVPWFPYPKMAVAELKPPTQTETFWDFTYMDSTMEALMNATAGHSVVINFSTTPSWLWKTDKPVQYPKNAYGLCWSYNAGTQLRDTTVKQLADYYERLFSWYTKGGFKDELGKFHRSNHHYKIDYWEVLNEPDFEHSISPQLYTKIYDAVVERLKKISPSTKFIGMSLAANARPDFFEYFLNHRNHKPGIPLDGISYHFYGGRLYPNQKLEEYQYAFFDKANAFLEKVKFIESIRKRLSPETITTINEIGTIIGVNDQAEPDIPSEYWNLSGAMYASIFLRLTQMGIDVAGESQLVGYPSQYPDVSMVNWKNGNPNARYWILKLLKDNIGAGDKLVSTHLTGGGLFVQAFVTPAGKKILLINPHDKDIKLHLPDEAKGASMRYVDKTTMESEAASAAVDNTADITLKPFAVAVVKFN